MTKEPESLSNPIEIEPPFLSRFQCGNTGIDYLHCVDSGKPGPHAMITSVVHGNEFSGAIAVAELIDNPPALREGKLSLCFANAEACIRFERSHPWHSRFIDEDLNRLWDEEVLNGPRLSLELERARELRSTIDSVDYLLDLHSMASVSPPVILAGSTVKGRRLAERLALGITIVMDDGHKAGRRLRDYGEFSEEDSAKTALLIECGQHWQSQSVRLARKSANRFLDTLGMISSVDQDAKIPTAKVIQITHTITANSNLFEFSEDYRGFETIAKAGTVIAKDGGMDVTTPCENSILVMPTHGVLSGQTAVRLGRILVDGETNNG